MPTIVPYLNQIHNIALPERRGNACAIACLAMTLRHLAPDDAPPLDALFDEGIAIGGLDAHKNWTHAGIVRLAHNHGLHAYSQEFRSLTNGQPSVYELHMVEEGIAKICRALASGGLVMASIPGRKSGSPHAVLLIGVTDENGGGFIYHDPDADEALGGANLFVATDDFRTKWRKLAIFFEQTAV